MDYSILDFGAKSGGDFLCTSAIQKTIDTCSENGGGRVVVPSGKYLTGTILLKSNVELHLEVGAHLLASPNLADYNKELVYPFNHKCSPEGWNEKHLIIAYNLENIAITGFGTIDGNADVFYGNKCKNNSLTKYVWRYGLAGAKDTVSLRPGQLICIIQCKNINISGVTMTGATCWTCYLHGCDFVQIKGIKIKNKNYHLNTDGVDIDVCRYVTLSDCVILTGDDSIAIRGCGKAIGDETRACEYITISNCVLSSSSSVFRIGVGTSPIKHVRISDIVAISGAILANFYPEWAEVSHTDTEDVHFTNISATDLGRVVEINVNNGTKVKNCSVTNVRAMAMAGPKLYSTSPNAVSDILLENIVQETIPDHRKDGLDANEWDTEGRTPAFTCLKGVNGLTIKNCKFNISKEILSTFERTIDIENCANSNIEDCVFIKD